MKLKAKFYLLVVCVSLITILLAVFLLVNFSNITSMMKYEKSLLQNQGYFKDLISYTDAVRLRGLEIKELKPGWDEKLEIIRKSINDIQNNTVRTLLSDDENELIDQALKSWEVLEPHLESLTEAYQELSEFEYSSELLDRIRNNGFISAVESTDDDDLSPYFLYTLASAGKVTKVITTVYDIFEKRYREVTNRLSSYVALIIAQFTIISIIVSILAAIAVFISVMFLSRQLISRVTKTQNMASRLAEKDLTRKMKEEGHDEITDLMKNLNHTVDILNNFFKAVKETSEVAQSKGRLISSAASDTASATHEINSNVESLRKQFGTLDYAVKHSISSLQEMSNAAQVLISNNNEQSSLIKDSTHGIAQIAQNVEVISNQAEEKTKSAQEIQFLVADGDEKMNAANSLLSETTSQLDEISEVVELINGIAEQTNILSMNAAIESAHAGESGKGFAVVAEEIRTLAESTTENAKRISSAIFAIIKNVKDASLTSKDASKAFSRVSEQAKDMMISLQDITNGVQNVDIQTKNVTSVTKKIAELSEKINEFSEQLSESRNVTFEQIQIMSDVFSEALTGIEEIQVGTGDIVERMTDVNSLSSESYDKIAELGSSLKEFVTS